MKKSIVALLIALALVILVSPGIIGRLAERSLEQDLDVAPRDDAELVVTPQGFDRGWFSSEGRHRIELRDGREAEEVSSGIGEPGVLHGQWRGYNKRRPGQGELEEPVKEYTGAGGSL